MIRPNIPFALPSLFSPAMELKKDKKKKKKKKKGEKCCKSYKDGKRCKDCPLYD